TGKSTAVASFAQPPSHVLGATAPSRKRKDGSSAPASGAGVGPNGGCPCPKVSVLVAAATLPPAPAAPTMSRRENSVIRNLLGSSALPCRPRRPVSQLPIASQPSSACASRRRILGTPAATRSNGGPMTALTLAQADRLIDAILARGAELDCRPLSVIV